MVRIKMKAEVGSEESVVMEDLFLSKVKDYNTKHYIKSILDLSVHVDNAYFRAPFNRCINCNKGNNTIMAHFGRGGSNKIGNLKGFSATIGDVIGWHSTTFSGISIVKSKDNGVYGLETSPFNVQRDEPAVIERMIIPSKYRIILHKMSLYLANKKRYKGEDFIKIGNTEYPSVIAKEL